MSIHVSVVVPTRGRPELLERCLAALATQEYDPDAFEIIVADDGDSEATRSLVERRAPAVRPTLRYLPVRGSHGPAAARNVGWRGARGEIIAFTDDDCLPQPDWLQRGLAAMSDGIAGCWGRIWMPLPESPTDYEYDAARLAEAGFVTANCFCRREALIDVGGFDERFTLAWREDSDLLFSLLAHGYRVVNAPEAVVVHPLRRAGWGISVRQQRKIAFDALLYKKHPRRYRQQIRPSPPWFYYAIVLALLLAVGGVAFGVQVLALGAGVCWSILTALLCIGRLRHTSHAALHLAEIAVTSALIPPLAVFWRLYGAYKFRVWFF